MTLLCRRPLRMTELILPASWQLPLTDRPAPAGLHPAHLCGPAGVLLAGLVALHHAQVVPGKGPRERLAHHLHHGLEGHDLLAHLGGDDGVDASGLGWGKGAAGGRLSAAGTGGGELAAARPASGTNAAERSRTDDPPSLNTPPLPPHLNLHKLSAPPPPTSVSFSSFSRSPPVVPITNGVLCLAYSAAISMMTSAGGGGMRVCM